MTQNGFERVVRGFSLSIALLCLSSQSEADSVAPRSADNTVEAEQASFKVLDGYEVNLFASEKDGIANPIAMRWDAQGRLWVLTTLAYAQLEPGKRPTDKLLILEDTDGDGRADTTRVWADGLNMPTGFALYKNGVYICEGMNLSFLSDTDGDGVADQKKVILSGFGVGDTHQNINSFTWGPAGDLWFSQGLHNYSRVETPWGIVRGEAAGFYRFRPDELKLEPFCMPSMASQNPWGIGFGRWGELFVKSNNKELGYITPGLIPTDHYQQLMLQATIAVTPGKSMGCEIVETAHLPELKDHVLIAGYYSNRVTAYPLKEEGSGFAQTSGKELLVASHPSFRPVETLIGPEGAIYIADWFNPIIGHYQASLRHPDRDKTHGRIWRMTAVGSPLVERRNLTSESPNDWIATLASPERWQRYQAKRLLAEGDPSDVVSAVQAAEVKNEHHLYELTGVLESHRRVDNTLVEARLQGEDPRLRAYGARMIGRWWKQLDEPLALLERCVSDSHPRVRLEAVVAASHMDSEEAMAIALQALDAPQDKFISYALSQCVHALADRWFPAVQSGRQVFSDPKHLVYAIGAYGGEASEAVLRNLVEASDGTDKRELLLLLAEVGGRDALKLAIESLPEDVALLDTLINTWKARGVQPAGDGSKLLSGALQSDDPDRLGRAIELAGYWKLSPLAERMKVWAADEGYAESVRQEALLALARIEKSQSIPFLKSIGASNANRTIRIAAAEALASLELSEAAGLSSELLATSQSIDESIEILGPYLSRRGGSSRLAESLAKQELSESAAMRIGQALSQSGRADEELNSIVNRALGSEYSNQEYDASYVEQLVKEVRESGDASRGEAVYHAPLLSCVACHSIKGQGGIIGPDLTTLGSGLPLELIAESVLWPDRQLKEGYFSIAVTTRDGRVYNGYREKEEGGTLWLRDIATREIVPLPIEEIRERNEVGTLMPAGLAASLSREELRDLLRFLWELRG